MDRAWEKRSACLLAVSGDFDGDGRLDYAAILPARDAQKPPLFVAASGSGNTWQLRELKIGTARPDGLVLELLPKGTYHETVAGLPDGVTGRSVSSTNDGISMGSCDSWANGYFLIGGQWFSMALTD